MDYISTLIDYINKGEVGKRSHFRTCLDRIRENGNQERAAERMLNIVAAGISAQSSLSNIAMKLGIQVGYLADYKPTDPPPVGEQGILAMGISILDWFAKEQWLKAEKFRIFNKKHLQFHAIPLGPFVEYCVNSEDNYSYPEITEGAYVWDYPLQTYEDNRMSLVKKSAKAGMLSHYYKDQMPLVYEAVNTLNAQQYLVNPWILELAEAAQPGQSFCPDAITEDELAAARKELNKIKRNALNRREYILKLFLDDETFDKNLAMNIATRKAIDYHKEKTRDHKEIISLWDQQTSFRKKMNIAQRVKGQTLNFCYDMDSRGRIYAMQPHLNPLSDDFAKALLTFKEPQDFEPFDFGIHTANLFGIDKVSFEARIDWLNENMENIRLFGEDPWGNWELLKSYGLGRKDKWQALAACRVWVEYHAWLEAGLDADNFKTKVMCTADCTNSGLQVLSYITRDEVIAPQVNIAPMADGSVGDIYMVVAKVFPKFLPDTCKELADAIRDNYKLGRKVVKRPSLAFSYDATQYGMGLMTYEDQKDFEHPVTDVLDYKQCIHVGQACYKAIQSELNRSVDFMNWLKKGVEQIPDDSPVLKWKMADGFTAFALKEKQKRVNARGMIGDVRVTLNAMKGTGKADIRKHKSAISANWVHAADSLLLRHIVRKIAPYGPISTVHDAYSVPSTHMEMLREFAREGFKILGDREATRKQMAEAFGLDRELPEPGSLDPNAIDNSEFFLS